MNNSYFSMRILSTVALLLFGFNSVALAEAPVSGKVVKVDQNARTFTVQWSAHWLSKHGNAAHDISHERTFKTTDKTAYTVGSNKGSWSDLKKGAHVTVTANAGAADKVQFVSGT